MTLDHQRHMAEVVAELSTLSVADQARVRHLATTTRLSWESALMAVQAGARPHMPWPGPEPQRHFVDTLPPVRPPRHRGKRTTRRERRLARASLEKP